MRRGVLVDPCKVFFSSSGIDDQPIALRAEIIGDQVVDHTALVIQHAAVKRLPGFPEPAGVVGEQVAQEVQRTATADIHNGHVRYIEYPGMLPDGMMLFELRAVM
jgi:hypothetical protein